MKLNIIREIVHTDENHRIHIEVPRDMGDEFVVLLMPVRPHRETADNLSEEDRFNLAAYSAVIDEDAEEDALWARYTHA
jgi:hypothetical protein